MSWMGNLCQGPGCPLGKGGRAQFHVRIYRPWTHMVMFLFSQSWDLMSEAKAWLPPSEAFLAFSALSRPLPKCVPILL